MSSFNTVAVVSQCDLLDPAPYVFNKYRSFVHVRLPGSVTPLSLPPPPTKVKSTAFNAVAVFIQVASLSLLVLSFGEVLKRNSSPVLLSNTSSSLYGAERSDGMVCEHSLRISLRIFVCMSER